MKRLSDEEFEQAFRLDNDLPVYGEAQRARESEMGLLMAARAAHLHLMVRPENRMVEADANVRELLRLAIEEAGGN